MQASKLQGLEFKLKLLRFRVRGLGLNLSRRVRGLTL